MRSSQGGVGGATETQGVETRATKWPCGTKTEEELEEHEAEAWAWSRVQCRRSQVGCVECRQLSISLRRARLTGNCII